MKSPINRLRVISPSRKSKGRLQLRGQSVGQTDVEVEEIIEMKKVRIRVVETAVITLITC